MFIGITFILLLYDQQTDDKHFNLAYQSLVVCGLGSQGLKFLAVDLES